MLESEFADEDESGGMKTSTLMRSAVGIAVLVLLGVLAFATRGGHGTFTHALTDLGQAQRGWLVVAGAGFAVAAICSAAAWRSGLVACGSTVGRGEATARYAVGSLVNTLAPGHLGGAVRLGLLAQTLPGPDRLWRAGGVAFTLAVARACAFAALIVAASVATALPLWPAPALVATAAGAVLLIGRLRRHAFGRLSSLLQVVGMLARSRGEALRVGGWVGASIAARFAGAIAVAFALGLGSPASAALVLLVALGLAGVVPITPGNLGTGAGAAALALHTTGVGLGLALATGVAFQAVETLVGLSFGLAGATVVATPRPRARHVKLVAAWATVLALAVLFGLAAGDFV